MNTDHAIEDVAYDKLDRHLPLKQAAPVCEIELQ
jgi:hypothetical protein